MIMYTPNGNTQSKTVTIKGFSEDAVNFISETKDEPTWMRAKRLSSWHQYLEAPTPSGEDESWRRTDISSLKLNDIVTYSQTNQPKRDITPATGPLAENYLFQRDSSVININLSKELQDKGVIFTDMDFAVQHHRDIIDKYFMRACVRPEHNLLSLLHTICWSGGVLLYVPNGLHIDIPFSAIYNISKPGMALLQHTIIIVGESSDITFVEESSSEKPYDQTSDLQSLYNSVVEIYLNQDARLNYISTQDLDDTIYSFSTKRVLADKDSSINWIEANVGSKLTKNHIETTLQGRGANAKIVGASYLNGKQHLDTNVVIHHKVPNTTGNILSNGVVTDSAKSIFQGMIKIDKDAQQTDSYMSNHNLILNDNAKADSIPKLEIKADEVKATHGVTVGQLDKEQLFYLMSRGLSENDAKDMLVDGFFESLINGIENNQLQEILRKLIAKKRGVSTLSE